MFRHHKRDHGDGGCQKQRRQDDKKPVQSVADGQIADETDDDRDHQDASGGDADDKGQFPLLFEMGLQDAVFFPRQFLFRGVIF